MPISEKQKKNAQIENANFQTLSKKTPRKKRQFLENEKKTPKLKTPIFVNAQKNAKKKRPKKNASLTTYAFKSIYAHRTFDTKNISLYN